MNSRRTRTRTPDMWLALVMLLGLAILPYGVQRMGFEAGQRVAVEAPAFALFTALMAALLVATYVIARKRRIIL